MDKFVFALLAGVLLIGCDPGWRYRVPDSQPNDSASIRYAEKDIDAKVSARLFSIGLEVEITLTNLGSQVLSIDPKQLRVLEATGKPLPKYESANKSLSADNVLEVAPGQTQRMRRSFTVNPVVGTFSTRNSDLKKLTVVLEGLSRAGTSVPFLVALEWQD